LTGNTASPGTSPSAGGNWYALRLRSRSEFAVRDALEAQGIESFLPTWEETVRWADRQAVTTRPLFSGYIFGRFDPATAQDAILRTRGVVQILGMVKSGPYRRGDCAVPVPESIPDEVIANLRLMAATPNALSPCPYVAGEAVTVRCGTYAGVEGIVVKTDGEAHLVVSVEFLGRSCRVKIDAADIE
jgi:transcription antitermination factor NusG